MTPSRETATAAAPSPAPSAAPSPFGAPRASALPAIRLLVVEDNFYIRYGIVAFLREQPGMDVLGEAASIEQARVAFQSPAPDVVIVGPRVRRPDGVQLTSWFRARAPDVGILMLTDHPGDEDIFQALQAGVRGYLTTESSGAELLAAISTLRAGHRYLTPEVLERLSGRQAQPQLTPRERQLLEHVAEGASNREAAEALGITERTAGLYVSNILSKLGARSRTEAAAIGARRGLLQSWRV